MEDQWKMFEDGTMCCGTCMYCVPKEDVRGRCRRNAPTIKGYPVVIMHSDFCGDHKLGTNPVTKALEPGNVFGKLSNPIPVPDTDVMPNRVQTPVLPRPKAKKPSARR